MLDAEKIIKVLGRYNEFTFGDKKEKVTIPEVIECLRRYSELQINADAPKDLPNLSKAISGLEYCTKHGDLCGTNCFGHSEWNKEHTAIIRVGYTRDKCPYGKCETGCVITMARDALELLKFLECVSTIND